MVSRAAVWVGAAGAGGDTITVACNIAWVTAWALATVLCARVVVARAGVRVGAAGADRDAVALARHIA